jgi:hypothetical protein
MAGPILTFAAPAEQQLPVVNPAILPLFRELGDLKRIRSAHRHGSIAERLFRGGWAALTGGMEPEAAMLRMISAALAAARLGDLDRVKLAELGLDRSAITGVLERAFDAVAEPIAPALAEALREALRLSPFTARIQPPCSSPACRTTCTAPTCRTAAIPGRCCSATG